MEIAGLYIPPELISLISVYVVANRATENGSRINRLFRIEVLHAFKKSKRSPQSKLSEAADANNKMLISMINGITPSMIDAFLTAHNGKAFSGMIFGDKRAALGKIFTMKQFRGTDAFSLLSLHRLRFGINKKSRVANTCEVYRPQLARRVEEMDATFKFVARIAYKRYKKSALPTGLLPLDPVP